MYTSGSGIPLWFMGARPLALDDSSDDSDTGDDSNNGWSSDNDPSAANPGGYDDTPSGDWSTPNTGAFGSFTQGQQDDLGLSGGWTTGPSGPTSYGPDGQEAPYGTYSSWDFDTYGWGSPETGFQSTPGDNETALQAIANQQQQAAFQSLMDQWSVRDGKDPEQEFQDQQEAQNVAGQGYGLGASPAAISEYNQLGLEGALTGTPWSYTDLNGQTNTNWGSVGHDALSTLGSFGGLAGALTGYGELGAIAAGLGNAVLGNIGSVTGLLGSTFGGTIGSGIGGVLGNLLSGREESAAKGAVNSSLNAAGLNLGSFLNSELGSKGAIENALGGMLGGAVQSSAIGAGLQGMGLTNTGSLSNALSGMLSSGGVSNTTGNNGDYRYG
jgi:hypothetical protein